MNENKKSYMTDLQRYYTPPRVLKTIGVQLELSFLEASVVNRQTKIETAGQEVEEHDFATTGFNSTWE